MDDEALHEIALRNDGIIELADAPTLGLSRQALREHARRHRWDRPHRRVIILPDRPMTFLRALLVAVKAAGSERVLVGRRAAAYVWGVVREPPREIELIVAMDRHDPCLDGLELDVTEDGKTFPVTVRVRRSRTLRTTDATDVGGIPVTTVARTIVDLACDLSVDRLRTMVIDARQRRVLTLADLDAIHARIRRYPGRAKITRILADLDEQDCDSRLEWDFRVEAKERGFKPYPRPFPFRCSDGVTIDIDLAFPAQWVSGECDGMGSHSDRASLVKDHKRQNRAVADGWRPFRIDWTRLKFHTDELFAELAELLASADRSRPPAEPADPAAVDPRFRSRRRRR